MCSKLRLRIPEKVGVCYTPFGTFLLDDKTGRLVQNIENTCNRQPDSVVVNILRRWLTDEPTPVTWENLIEVLKMSGLNTLASEVQEYRRNQ